MDKKNETPTGQQGKLLEHDKGIKSYRPKQEVRRLFLNGGKYTAVELNQLIGFNDARKVISDLRNKEGMDIQDCILPDGRKLYWLVPDSRQGELFGKGNAK